VKRARPASVARSVRLAIVAHARTDAPKECCGLLIGEGRRVDFAVPLSNVDPNPIVGFRIDPAEHIAVRRIVRRLTPALSIVGVYHSHPRSAAVPSPRDIAECHYPDWIFVIVGRAGRSVRAYRLRAEGPAVVPIAWRKSPQARRPR
jgi:proteasome lid subunit RPN8/RPN11